MNQEQLAKKTELICKQWIHRLEKYTPEQFAKAPSQHEWTVGQVYCHCVMAANFFFFQNANRCLTKYKTIAGQPNFSGKLVLFFNMIPPGRYKMPDKVATVPPQPDTKEIMIEGLKSVIEAAHELKIALDKNPDRHSCTKHPFFGALNAQQWFQMNNIHFRHHEKQLARLDKFLGVK